MASSSQCVMDRIAVCHFQAKVCSCPRDSLSVNAIVEVLVDMEASFQQVLPWILRHHKDSALKSGPHPQQTSHE